MSPFWDARFAEPGYKYGTKPNAWLRQNAPRLAAHSRVLVPGDGEGRNSVWLAQQGHHVLAMDSSAVGLAKAQALATERGVVINTLCVDLADWVPEPNSVDAVVLVYVHLPSALRAVAHRRLANALAPGGWLVLEAFHPLQIGRDSGGPKDNRQRRQAPKISPALRVDPKPDRLLAQGREAACAKRQRLKRWPKITPRHITAPSCQGTNSFWP